MSTKKAVVISHFDHDHYSGLTSVLKNSDYTFGTIYHNGLPRYGDPAAKDLNLGSLSSLPDGSKAISTDLRDLDSAQELLDSDDLLTENNNLNKFGEFLEAAIMASKDNRLNDFKLLAKTSLTAPASAITSLVGSPKGKSTNLLLTSLLLGVSAMSLFF